MAGRRVLPRRGGAVPDIAALKEKGAKVLPVLALYLPAAAFLGITFYDALPAALLFLPLFPWVFRFLEGVREGRETERMRTELLDLLTAFASALSAGMSAENAFAAAREGRAEGGAMDGHWRAAVSRVRAGSPFPASFAEMARRSGLPEAGQMSEALAIVRVQGGDAAECVRTFVRARRERQEVAEQQRALLSGKRLEGWVMKLTPVLVVWFLRLSSPGFLDPLYHTAAGRVLMTLCLLAYAGGIRWENRIFSALS